MSEMSDSHNESRAPQLDYSTVDQWILSHAAMSDVLTIIAFCHPKACMVGALWDFDSRETRATIEAPRVDRTPRVSEIVNDNLPASLILGLPGIDSEQASSLGSELRFVREMARGCGASSPDWAKALGKKSLGLGLGQRFDDRYEDGVDRSTPEAIAIAERAFYEVADYAPDFALKTLLAGTRFLSGPEQAACQSLMSIIEADEIDNMDKPRPGAMATPTPDSGLPLGRKPRL